jgi:hypothetical protein
VIGFGSRKPSDRLRAIGVLVSVLSILTSAYYYWFVARPASLAMDEVIAGYQRSMNRQIGILMGHTGVMMLEWQEVLDRPGTKAILIAAAGGLFALYFFRSAWVLDEEERDRRQERGDG